MSHLSGQQRATDFFSIIEKYSSNQAASCGVVLTAIDKILEPCRESMSSKTICRHLLRNRPLHGIQSMPNTSQRLTHKKFTTWKVLHRNQDNSLHKLKYVTSSNHNMELVQFVLKWMLLQNCISHDCRKRLIVTDDVWRSPTAVRGQ